MKDFHFIIVVLLFLPISIDGQSLLSISRERACSYHAKPLPKDLYVIKKDSISNICEKIIQSTNLNIKIEIIASNVESASAILDSTHIRYLLYSRRHFLINTDRARQIGILAHEIGHHANEHTFEAENRETEEIEADEFMGFALYRMGVLREDASTIARQYPLANHSDSVERRKAIMRGFDRGEASLAVAPYAAFNDNGSGNAIPGIPEFPFPPPQASASFVMDDFFVGCKSLSEVDKRLNKALRDCGYSERRYYYVKGGYVLVTRLEQVNKDGYSFTTNRWNPKPVREETFSWTSYLKSLFVSEPGYFRVFAIVVTDEPFATSKDRKVTRADAESWLSEGCFKLPAKIGEISFTPNTNVVGLVYEFQVPDTDRKPILSKPSALTGETHLQNSNILKFLK